jgi:hypothetical protein
LNTTKQYLLPLSLIFSLVFYMAPSHASKKHVTIQAAQGWSEAQRNFYRHASQGTVVNNLQWFMALEKAGSQTLISDSGNLASLGFIKSSKSTLNPLGLPIGFAVGPANSSIKGTVGLTCAACHTGQLSYKGDKIVIDGTQSMIDSNTFGSQLQLSMIETYHDPDKWNRFARKVLKNKYNDSSEKSLRLAFGNSVKNAEWELDKSETLHLTPVPGGYGRNDAIDTIGNKVFASDLQDPANFHVADANVSFPFIWDAWQFDWVQYDGSIVQPMVRNAGEALGVGAITNYLYETPTESKWASSINVTNIYKIETQLQALKPPLWPANMFGPYNLELAKQGRELFMENCASCHAPRPILPPGDKYAKLAVKKIPLQTIGTDPKRSTNATTARFDATKLVGHSAPNLTLSEGLTLTVGAAKEWAYTKINLPLNQRGKWDGFDRPNIVKFESFYKARTLDGIWSSPPYLHNGSVRNIYELLSPVNERATQFWVGLSDYDPVNLGVGPKVNKNDIGFLMDTTLAGNSNTGHENSNTSAPGVIGRLLSPNERMALIEYMKALPEMPPSPQQAVKLDYWRKPHGS